MTVMINYDDTASEQTGHSKNPQAKNLQMFNSTSTHRNPDKFPGSVNVIVVVINVIICPGSKNLIVVVINVITFPGSKNMILVDLVNFVIFTSEIKKRRNPSKLKK